MFDILSVCYLFLGGSGSGVLLLCSLIDLLSLRQSSKDATRRSAITQPQGEQFLRAGFIVGEVLLLTGIVCLVLDIGRQDRILGLLLNPSLSILTIGAYALGTLALLGFLLVSPRLFSLPSIGATLVRVTEVVTVCVSFVSLLYTGLLLFSMKAVYFWDNPLLPAVFVLSSLSSGVAVLVIVGFFSEKNEWCSVLLRRIVLIDSVMILLEIVCAAALLWIASLSTSVATQESLKNLLFEQGALPWWIGFALCGMVFPLVLELLYIKSGRRSVQTGLAIGAALLLVGAFCLRYGLVEVGTQGNLVEGYVNSDVQNTERDLRDTMPHD